PARPRHPGVRQSRRHHRLRLRHAQAQPRAGLPLHPRRHHPPAGERRPRLPRRGPQTAFRIAAVCSIHRRQLISHLVVSGGEMQADYYRLLYDYNWWARDRLFAAATGMSDEDYARPNGFTYGSLRGILTHILDADVLWLA